MQDFGTKADNSPPPGGQLSAAEFNNLAEENENAVLRSGQALSGGSATQLATSLFLHAVKAQAFQDSGTANAYVGTPVSGINGVLLPATYAEMNGSLISFIASNANSGNSTLNIGQTTGVLLGSKKLLTIAGAELPSGTITAGLYVQAQFNSTLDSGNGAWEIVNGVTFQDFLNTTRLDVASAANINLTSSAPNTRHINITGGTTVTAFTVAIGKCYFVRFNAELTLTNNGSIVTQTGANILTVAGDTCIIRATAANVVEVLCYSRVQRLTTGVSQSAAGTAIDFTGIPSWVKKITVALSNVSTNGTSGILFQIGSGSVDTTGYVSSSAAYDTGVSAMSSTAGYVMRQIVAANASHGTLQLTNVTGNQWLMSGAVGNSGTAGGTTVGGSKTLSGVLDRVRMTSVNGTDTFDSGNINILYEG